MQISFLAQICQKTCLISKLLYRKLQPKIASRTKYQAAHSCRPVRILGCQFCAFCHASYSAIFLLYSSNCLWYSTIAGSSAGTAEAVGPRAAFSWGVINCVDGGPNCVSATAYWLIEAGGPLIPIWSVSSSSSPSKNSSSERDRTKKYTTTQIINTPKILDPMITTELDCSSTGLSQLYDLSIILENLPSELFMLRITFPA